MPLPQEDFEKQAETLANVAQLRNSTTAVVKCAMGLGMVGAQTLALTPRSCWK
jgi:hypothetical protein